MRTPPQNPPDHATAPLDGRFRDPEAARANLDRLRPRVPESVFRHLTTLIGQGPDPDASLNLFERLSSEERFPEVLRLMEHHPFLLHYALVVFGRSQWLGETLVQNPDVFHTLERDRNLDRSYSREDFAEHFARFRSRSFETDISTLLARFKKREYVRIMLRDVLAIATLADTTAEISALSDVLIEEALRYTESVLHARYGAPRYQDAAGRVSEPPFTVISMGKLGGRELNYSSDIDLLYLFGDGERPGSEVEGASSAAISNREYFIRLAQTVTEVLTRMTREGPVFRIDLRLRPQGREGEPAVALRHALDYYAGRAHDWELQALIKARHSAGDVALARTFLRAVLPHVYRPELNFAAIETALKSRSKIGTHRRRAASRAIGGGGIDVKVDPGGIRDIEFLVQCLQRVYGGAEPWLRSSGTLFSLQKLHDKMHLSGKDFHELHGAYEYLRRVEHALQLRRGQQTHRLPAAEDELAVLARALESRSAEVPSTEDFVACLRRRMDATAEIYRRIIHRQQQQQGSEMEFFLRPPESGREYSIERILERLASEAPAIHDLVTRRDLAAHTRRNLHRFLGAAMTSSERYAALLRSATALERGLRIFATSDFLSDILVRHTEEIELLERIAPPAPGEPLFAPLAGTPRPADSIFRYVAQAAAPYGEKMAQLRRHYRHCVLRAGARELMAPRAVYDTLDETSQAAEDAIAAALDIAGRPAGFAILALGRLGTREFDIASDADLLFVRDDRADPAQCQRAAEQIIEILAAYTRDGTVFPVDARLRPRGAEGELVVTPGVLASYFAEEAQAWEALTYTKLRFLAGDTVGVRAVAAVRDNCARFPADPAFVASVREMRAKLEKTDADNFKTAPGGFYDIDFIVTALLVRHGLDAPHGNIRERLHALASRGLLSDNDCATLDYAAELLRTAEHVIRLVLGKARKSLPATEHARRVTEELTGQILGREFTRGLAAELQGVMASVREVFDRVVR